MKKYQSGDKVSYGFYVSARPFDFTHVGVEGQALDGEAGAKYARIPTWAAVLASPVIGGAFVLLFPLLVVAGIAYTLVAGVKHLLGRGEHLGRVRWSPSAAYLHETDTKDTESEVSEGGSELTELESEVESRRAEEDQSK